MDKADFRTITRGWFIDREYAPDICVDYILLGEKLTQPMDMFQQRQTERNDLRLAIFQRQRRRVNP